MLSITYLEHTISPILVGLHWYSNPEVSWGTTGYYIRDGYPSNSESLMFDYPCGNHSPENRFGDKPIVHQQYKGSLSVENVGSSGRATTGGVEHSVLLLDRNPYSYNMTNVFAANVTTFQHYKIEFADTVGVDEVVFPGLHIRHMQTSGGYKPVKWFISFFKMKQNDFWYAHGYWIIDLGRDNYVFGGDESYFVGMRYSTPSLDKIAWDDLSYIRYGYDDRIDIWSTTAKLTSLVIPSRNDVSENLSRYARRSLDAIPSVSLNRRFGTLADRILSSTSFPQVNVPAYLRDLLRTPADIMKLVRSIKKGDIKSISDSYLSYKYGISLTVKDTLDLVRFMTKSIPSLDWVSRKASQLESYETEFGHADVFSAYKIYFSLIPTETTDLIDQLFLTDIIGIGNAWDLIPFSFVVDWFTGIGDLLESIDNTVSYNTLPVDSTVWSIKTEITVPSSRLGDLILAGSAPVTGGMILSKYQRVISKSVITPELALDVPSNFNHFIEAGALIVSTRHRR